MSSDPQVISTRPAVADDIRQMCRILNEIIEIGGTTAFETPFTEDALTRTYLTGDDHLSCFVALDGSGSVAGFQALLKFKDLRDRWADIATFARPRPKVPGVGKALFAATRAVVEHSGITAINATIRADNTGGLTYYGKLGFETYEVEKGRPLADGTRVDRIYKRFLIQ